MATLQEMSILIYNNHLSALRRGLIQTVLLCFHLSSLKGLDAKPQHRILNSWKDPAQGFEVEAKTAPKTCSILKYSN